MPEIIQTAQSHSPHFLGPNVLSVLAQSVETGVIVNQASRFMVTTWERENVWVRSIVVFACLLAFVQTGFAFSEFYDLYVTHFGSWAHAISPSTYDQIQPILTVLQAAPIQAYLIWRCYRILGRRWHIVLPLVILFFGSCITNILVYTQMIREYDFIFLVFLPLADYTEPILLSPYFVAALSTTAMLDLSITSILTIFLWRSKGEVYSRRFRTAIDQLIVFLWESAIPPAACACATILTYALDLQENNNWDLFFLAALGKLYVISFFVTLNSRDLMRSRSLSPETINISDDSVTPPIHLHLVQVSELAWGVDRIAG